jgi:hypothetical protein
VGISTTYPHRWRICGPGPTPDHKDVDKRVDPTIARP